MIYQSLGLLALLAFLYGSISGWIERTPVNGALLFTLFGVIFGSAGLGMFDLGLEAEGLRVIAEITLGIVLFSDAAGVNFGVLQKSFWLPERLLVIGLPLTILLGFGLGALIFDGLSWLEIAILATMLAPTDAALGKAVVSNEAIDASIRTGLNVESGLNDGICVPVLFAFLALALEGGVEGGFVFFMGEVIGIGLAVGLGVTWLCVQLLRVSSKRDWLGPGWRQLVIVSIAVVCFTVAQLLGGSGFIAAFCGGLLFGRMANTQKHELLESAEATGDALSMVTWAVFGAAVVGPSLGAFGWDVLLYSLLSLTVVRMVPVLISLTGSPLSTAQRLFVGWFGPRGLASIVFAVIVLGENLPGIETITMTVICTVFLSVILHGLSANPLVAWMAGDEQ
jgi:NhaP-type Na+/H+ or K+/H+ antiporter